MPQAMQKPAPAAPPALVCLPPAGAGPSLFGPWRRADPAILAPTLPGREARFREPPASDLARLADRIALDLIPTLPPRYGLFGYSMGGTLAFLLARRLVSLGRPGPEAFFVLGALAPDRLGAGTEHIHALESGAFWEEIGRIGGTPAEIIADAEMRALFEPVLRDDFRLCESYRHAETGFRLACPVHVMVAEEDHLVGAESAGDWQRHATGPVTLHRLPGAHMLGRAAFAALPAELRSLWERPPG